jgi:hypothetical protein
MVAMARERRLLLQGGLSPTESAVGAVLEIACDESGFSGSNLLDPASPVFIHASIDLRVEEAVELIESLRSRSRWPLTEFKSGQLLRSPQANETVRWLLTELSDRAHVLAVDKEYFLVTRIVDLLLTEPSYAAGTRLTENQREPALTVYRAGRVRGRDWSLFLAAFVDLVRTKRRRLPDDSRVERFLRARDVLAGGGLGTKAEGVLDGLTRSRVAAVVARLGHDDRSIPPPLEPMLPALAETVLFWSGGRRQVLVVHDEQSALTAGRLRRLQRVLTDSADLAAVPAQQAEELPGGMSPLAGLVTVDSRHDLRVQVADILAGIARTSLGIGDDNLLQPFVSPTSLRDPER